jgi:hypothetical protein
MTTYTEFVDLIHGYTNRTTNVLPYSNIKTFADMASDTIYRKLRIPPLEITYTYAAATADTSQLEVPGDLIEFTQLRKLDEDGEVECVYNARADIRSFYLDNMTKYDGNFYTREGPNLLVYPEIEEGDVMQLFYFRRLPSIYARFALTTENYAQGLLYTGASAQACSDVLEAAEPNAQSRDPDLTGQIEYFAGDVDVPEGWYVGQLAANWLRDENLKMVLYGTQKEAYIYLKDAEKAAAAGQLMVTDLQELNDEAVLRQVRGGVAQTHYSGGLIGPYTF